MALKNMLTIFLIYYFCHENFAKLSNTNLRPIIGIVSQIANHKFTPFVADSDTYIAASYVKYLEMGGAQVVPILPSYSNKKIKHLLRSINGVLFPGGASPINDSGYYSTAKIVFQEAKNMNNKGIYFPLWGTCLGFETLHSLVAGVNVLTQTASENLPLPLNFTRDAFSSRLFKDMNKKMMTALMFEKITLNLHQMGVSPNIYAINRNVNAMFRVLSTNLDAKGKKFVSTVEGIKYPFYGTQWHPEKNIFEWTRKELINHSPAAIYITQYFATFFVNEARKNFQHFKSHKEEEQHLIFRYTPSYSGGRSLFEQVYVFGNSTETLIN